MESTFDLWKFVTENTLGFVFTTLFLGAIVEFVRRGWEYLTTWKYRGWTLTVYPVDSARGEYTHKILWQEVQRFDQSAFEKRKFIQSVVSSEGGWLYAGEVNTTGPDGWVYEDKAKKQFRFTMSKLPPRPNS